MALLNKISYAHRLFIWLLCYSCLLGGCLILFQYFREKKYKADELNESLQVVNAHILGELEISDDVDFAKEYSIDNLRVSIIDLYGNVLYDNSLDTLPGGDHRQREEIASALRSGTGYSVRRVSDTTGDTYFYSARRDGDFIVRTAVPYSATLAELLTADFTFLWIMLAIVVIMCILGYFATKRIGIHVKRLREFAAKAERGEKIEESTFPHDELGDISSNIVNLYARLQQAIADRDREHAAALREEQDKIRIKRQLTNNISHELKTPLASIKVCLESMINHKDMTDERRDDFINRCYANCERLQRLLSEVSVITRLEEGGAMVDMGELDLGEIVAEACAEMSVIADAHGIKIDNKVEKGLCLNGNRQLLLTVFRNLIENAASYSGGSLVTIYSQSPVNGRIEITFYDNGAGVGEEHLGRLFERFYRVDKGRSRKSGGTGLGLSIVKNAITLHGGTITVGNRPEGGLRFIITL